MQINTIKYANKEQTSVIINGGTTAPYPLQNFMGEFVEKWLEDEENIIEEYQTVVEAIADKKQQVTGWRNSDLESLKVSVEIDSTTYEFDADERSMTLLTAAVTLFTKKPGAIPTDFKWRTSDNINVPVTLDDLENIGVAMMGATNQAFKKSWDLKDQMDDPDEFKTIEAVGDIAWN